jgi:hypothetical protein
MIPSTCVNPTLGAPRCGIGMADWQLERRNVSQKPELRGRPLDGSYRLIIWDDPSLQWNHLEDVQFVINYRYWAPISVQSGANGQ